jgi:hypothetical protein
MKPTPHMKTLGIILGLVGVVLLALGFFAGSDVRSLLHLLHGHTACLQRQAGKEGLYEW